MIIFNLLPIYPLDGFRIIHDLMNNKDSFLMNEVLHYISILCLSILLIYFYCYRIWGLVLIFNFLIIINGLKLKELYRKKQTIHQIISYDLMKFVHNNKVLP